MGKYVKTTPDECTDAILKCTAKRCLLRHLGRPIIEQEAYRTRAMTPLALRQTVITLLHSTVRRGPTFHAGIKGDASSRKRMTHNYRALGEETCQRCFCTLHDINANRLTVLRKRVHDGTLDGEERRGGQRRSAVFQARDDEARLFITQFAGEKAASLKKSDLNPEPTSVEMYRVFADSTVDPVRIGKFRALLKEHYEAKRKAKYARKGGAGSSGGKKKKSMKSEVETVEEVEPELVDDTEGMYYIEM